MELQYKLIVSNRSVYKAVSYTHLTTEKTDEIKQDILKRVSSVEQVVVRAYME